jgi:folate-dependent phosphoribosylglycinamide formyltransferase PurN
LVSATGRVVILATESLATNALYHAMNQRLQVAAVIIEKPVTRSAFLRYRVKQLGYGVVAGQMAFQAVIIPVLRLRRRARLLEIARNYQLNEALIDGAVVRHVETVNSDATRSLLRELSPAVVVVSGTRIISTKTLQAVSCPFINLHAGITPLFRGVHGGYWALASGMPQHCGVTVHLVDAGVDSGGILNQATIEPTSADNFLTYPLLQLGKGLPLLVRAAEDAVHGSLDVKPPPPGESRLWFHPTLWGYLWRALTRNVK